MICIRCDHVMIPKTYFLGQKKCPYCGEIIINNSLLLIQKKHKDDDLTNPTKQYAIIKTEKV